MIYKIRPITEGLNKKDEATVLFAAKEIQKYLSFVSDNDFSVIRTAKYNKLETNAVYVGIKLSETLPEVENSELDDALLIDVKAFTGYITGTNARSVLIAAYRYLKELGFVFLHPGKNGECYPDTLNLADVYLCEKASYRHRGICIEGAVFQKNLTDIIDWLPKASMNGYFIQFQRPRAFFDHWYSKENPYREKEALSDDDIMAILSLGEEEIEKRSILYHGVGHGWTTQVFGIDGSSWSTHEEPEPQYKEFIALVNGERKLWKRIPLNTNLCYSNPIVRERVTDNIVKYCMEHPNLTYLHFWLADDMNNYCECENCRVKRSSDFYVQMLNELDEKLTKAKISTRIVFLLYFDLLWKPLYERLINSERFVLMFAPISRSYSESFDADLTAEMGPYELNKLKFPVNVGENLAYLKDWQQDVKCDSFDFDYHFMWDHYFDFAQYKHARVVYEDIKNLEEIGLNGLISCQVQRAFFPSSLNMNIMAETLWNKDVDFDAVSDRVFMAEFGSKYTMVQEYLSTLSESGCAKALRGDEDIASDKNVKSLSLAIQTIEDFKPVIEEELANSGKRSAWQKLELHAELYKEMLKVYLEAAKGNEIGDFEYIKDIALKNEMRFKDEFDAVFYARTFTHIVGKLNRNTDESNIYYA